MELYRITYYDKDGEASEAIVEAEEGNEAIAKVEDLERFCQVESLGAVEDYEDDEEPEAGPGKPEDEPQGDVTGMHEEGPDAAAGPQPEATPEPTEAEDGQDD